MVEFQCSLKAQWLTLNVLLIVMYVLFLTIHGPLEFGIAQIDHLLTNNIGNVSSNSAQLIDNQTTIVIMAYTNNEALKKILTQYSNVNVFSDLISEIVIVWNDPNVSFAFNHSDHSLPSIPIRVYSQSINSLANRWFITRYHTFKTASAMMLDDDMFIPKQSLQCLLNAFRSYPARIVGMSSMFEWRTPRIRRFKSVKGSPFHYEYSNPPEPYLPKKNTTVFNMILPSSSLYSITNLGKIAHLLDTYHLVRIIDEQSAHCDDIAATLLSTIIANYKPFIFGIDGLKASYYEPLRRAQQLSIFGPGGEETATQRFAKRSECLSLMINAIMQTSSVLQLNRTHLPIVAHYELQDTVRCIDCHHCNESAYACEKEESP